MFRSIFTLLITSLFFLPLIHSADKKTKVYTNPKGSELPVDFKYQGEYIGKDANGTKLGCQVIALGNGAFHAVLYPGGLPGAGWNGKDKSLMQGDLINNKVNFKAASGKRSYVHKDPNVFSATKVFPPEGHQENSGTIQGYNFSGSNANGVSWTLTKTLRKSPTLGQQAPSNALVLFDGSNKDHFTGGRLDETTKLLNTDGKDIRTKKKFSNYTVHIEFMLPFRPEARGQGRGNSGVYHVDQYETQVLDTFGLMGLDNECGGIYKKKISDVNMCLPPLTWQTYDVTFHSAVVENGQKVKNARITAKLNGVTIHDDFELDGKTGGASKAPEGTPGHIRLQGHGNPLQYRNIWIIEH